MVDENNQPVTPPSGDTPNQLEETPAGEGGDIAERGKSKKDAESRIHELVDNNKTLAENLKATQDKLAALEQRLAPPSNTTNSPVTQKTVEYLKSLGFTQKAEVDAQVQAVRDRMALDTEHMRLSGEYDGADGRPAYNQTEIEKFMRDQGIYNPEVAYKAMHEAELLDWSMKKANGNTRQKPYIEKPGSTQSNREDDTITREKLEEWMKTPEGRIKYEQNRQKILSLMSEGKL